MSLPLIRLPTSLKSSLAQGHPWVYRNHLGERVRLPSGTWVQVQSGGWKGYGLYDAQSLIAVRLFPTSRPPDAAWVRERVEQAWALRAPLRASYTNTYRWLYGEGDGLPAVTVDLYDSYAVVATYAESVNTLLPWVVDALHRTAPLEGIVLRRKAQRPGESESDHEADDTHPGKIELLWGELPPRDLIVTEHGLNFRADLFEGQKTGLFLDQRENRRWLEGWSAGKTVLNCFAYTGGFSVYAVRGGATRVTSVDIAPRAMADAAENFQLNGFSPEDHEFHVGDVFTLLADYTKAKQRFDVVVLDPPSLAHNKTNLYAALRAYAKLNTLGAGLVRAGGLLVSSSCTSQVSHDAFLDVLAQAGASANRTLQIIHDAGHPLDHPIPSGFPEGRYLKFVASRVLPR